MASSNTVHINTQWQPGPVVQALQDAVKYPRTSPSWFDILYPRKEEQPQPKQTEPLPPQPEPQQPPQQAEVQPPSGKN